MHAGSDVCLSARPIYYFTSFTNLIFYNVKQHRLRSNKCSINVLAYRKVILTCKLIRLLDVSQRAKHNDCTLPKNEHMLLISLKSNGALVNFPLLRLYKCKC